MYFPYLRGKQNELLALEHTHQAIRETGNIIPVIEPVKSDTTTLVRTVKVYSLAETPYIVIVNPTVGDFKNNSADVLNKLLPAISAMGQAPIAGYILDQNTLKSSVDNFLKWANSKGMKIAFVHRNPYSHSDDLIGLDSVTYHESTVRTR